MNYKENINYRRSIEKKVMEKIKLTDEEKIWLSTNPRYNEKYSFPCLQRDIIAIPKNREINMVISELKNQDKTKIFRPVIGVVGKGKIKVAVELYDYDMRHCNSKETSILIPLFNRNRDTVSVRIYSELGLISVAYQCEYYDERMRLRVCEMSDGAKLSYGMKRCDISEKEFAYLCKSPTVSNDNFDSYTFSIKTEQ